MVLKREKPLSSNLNNETNYSNYSNFVRDYSYCGVNGCPQIKSGESKIPPKIETVSLQILKFSLLKTFCFKVNLFKVYTMCYIYIASAILAIVIVVLFLDNYKPKNKRKLIFLFFY